jgi:hypothetical protein
MSCILPRSDPQRNLNTYTIVYWPQSSDRESTHTCIALGWRVVLVVGRYL